MITIYLLLEELCQDGPGFLPTQSQCDLGPELMVEITVSIFQYRAPCLVGLEALPRQ